MSNRGTRYRQRRGLKHAAVRRGQVQACDGLVGGYRQIPLVADRHGVVEAIDGHGLGQRIRGIAERDGVSGACTHVCRGGNRDGARTLDDVAGRGHIERTGVRRNGVERRVSSRDNLDIDFGVDGDRKVVSVNDQRIVGRLDDNRREVIARVIQKDVSTPGSQRRYSRNRNSPAVREIAGRIRV